MYIKKFCHETSSSFFTGTLDSVLTIIFIIIIIIYIHICDAIISISFYYLCYLYKSFYLFFFLFLLKIYFSATLLYFTRWILNPRFDIGCFSIRENRLKSNARVVQLFVNEKMYIFKIQRKERNKIYLFIFYMIVL